jgi:hypothetical protein
MATPTVVVDGSNIATEGRSVPSLAQLDEAVRAFLSENNGVEVLVVVDASFGYRIDESERQAFEEAEEAGEIVSPPAGAIGRGDGFLLRIADRVDAAVLSNDSFQEFHGEYKWLFDEGRLVGGKPVPGVGWIFTPRTPVRGPKSRIAVRDAKKAAGAGETTERKRRKRPESGPVASAIAEATAAAITPEGTDGESNGQRTGRASRRRTRGKPSPGTVNEPLPFITFIAEHHLGTEVEGVVDEFTSHGAFVAAAGARCYVPLSGLGSPPPRSAKQVLKRGESRSFVVQALDPARRGIELALPEMARVAGAPTEETVEAEIVAGAPLASAGPEPAEDAQVSTARSRKATAKKAAAKKAVPKEAVPKETAPKRVAPKKVAPKKVAQKKVAAKKAPPKKLAAKQTPPAKKASPAKKPPAKAPAETERTARPERAAPPPKKAPAKKVAAGDKAAKATEAKKASVGKKAAAANKAPVDKAAKAPATKRPTAKKRAPSS